jgi:flagellar motor switch protein FliM
MHATKLNHTDVDDLPDAIPFGELETTMTRGRAAEPPVKHYDFRNPIAVDRGLLRTLHNLHVDFAREFAVSLSTLVRNPIEVKLLGVEQLSVREFLARLDNPTCLSILHAEPLPESWIVDIQPSVFYPIIDSMLGGGNSSGPTTRRPPTEIELCLAGRIGEILCEKLRHTWGNVADLRPKLLRIESHPRAVQAAPSDDGAIVVRLGVSLGQRRGMMRLCLPGKTLEPLRDRLSAEQAEWCAGRPASPENAERIGREVCGSQTEVDVCLAESTISTQDLIGLRVGDIITTSKDVHSPLVVAVAGVPKFHARPGAVRGRKAIVITESLNG